jgi:hypothetical protein
VLLFISGATAAGLNELARLCKKRRAAIGVPINVLRFIPAASPGAKRAKNFAKRAFYAALDGIGHSAGVNGISLLAGGSG